MTSIPQPPSRARVTQRDVPPFAPPAKRWRRNDLARNSPVPAVAPRVRGGGTSGDLRAATKEDSRDAVAKRFNTLAERWREDTQFHSSITALFMHPAYQEIIGLGPDALPLILEDLAATRSDWFWALRAISGENPVPAAERGQIGKMVERWLEWGHAHGYL